MEDKTSLTRPRQRLLAAAIAGLMAAAAAPAMADSEIDALKRELAEQRKLIEKLLADRDADKKAQAAAPAPAAQAGVAGAPAVTIYGVIDGGVERITNVQSGTAKGTVTRMPSITASLPSRIGISAVKEIQPGLKVIGTAEIGMNSDDGSLGQGGRIFGRQLFAGLDTAYGTFTYGRQWSMLLYAMMGSDFIGPNIYALGSLDPYLASMRYDNSLAWRAKFDKVSLGGLYSFARVATSTVIPGTSGAPLSGTCAGEVAGTSTCRGWSLMAKYDDARWGVSGAIDNQQGGTGATAYFFNQNPVSGPPTTIALSRSEDSDRRTNLGGYVKFGPAKVGVGLLNRKVEAATGTTRSKARYLEGSYAITEKITVDGGYVQMRNADQDKNANLYVLRGFYSIDKALTAYLQVGHIANSSNAAYALSVGPGVAPPAGGSQTGTMAGLRYMF